MSSILDLRLFYEKGINFELYDYIDTNLEGDLDNYRSTFSYLFI